MKRITFTLSTNRSGPVVRRTVSSLSKLLTRYGHECNLLIIDKTPGAETIQWLKGENSLFEAFVNVLELDAQAIYKIELEKADYLKEAEVELDRDSIQRTRVQMVLAIMHFRKDIEGTILWQLDDDMVFEYSTGEIPFPDVVEKVITFNNQFPDVDASSGTGFHTPPLPILLYLEKNLKDLIDGRPLPLKGLSTSPNYYHDLYPDLKFWETTPKIERSEKDVYYLLLQILSGDPMFRPIPDEFFEPEKPWHRGGNFILFNMDIALSLPHLALHYRGLISRRSDMIHARLLHDAGFKLSGIALGLYHYRERNQNPDFLKIKLEYLRDALGAIAVRFLEDEVAAFDRLIQHQLHIDRLIALAEKLNKNFNSSLTEDLIIVLGETKKELSIWETEELKSSLSMLRKRYDYLLDKFKKRRKLAQG